MNLTMIKNLMVLALAAMMAGCNTSPNAMVGQETTGGLSAYISIANPGLQRDIALVQAASKLVNDLLQAMAVIKSHARTAQEFEYMFAWYDADGFEIRDTKAHWALDRIQGMEEKQLTAMAPNEQAAKFKLMIREPQPITR